MQKILEGLKVVGGIAPSSDIYNGNPASDVISMKNHSKAVFVLTQKTGGSNTGKATVTVEACDDVTPSNTEAIAFSYYKNEAVASSDDVGSKQTATASGFSTTANKTALYLIEVDARDLPAGKPFIRCQLTESTDDPVLGALLVLVGGGESCDPDTALTAIS